MHRCWLLALCWLSASRAQQEDSLRGALEAVSRRHHDISGPYFIGQPRTSQIDDELPYFENQEYGQPEDIGYGYQKSMAPHTAGIFEPVALPSSELGAHEALANNHLPQISEKELERLASDYLGDEPDNSRLIAHRLPTGYKRSVFRERDEPRSEAEALQMADAEPNMMRGPTRVRNALTLVRNFGGLDRDQESAPGPDSSDPDAYLRLLNYVYHKYRAGAPEIDPEEIGDGDVEELIEYLGRADNHDKKRSDHNGGYEYFNHPGAWFKRSEQRLDSPQGDGFFHALKFLSSDRDVLEAMRNEEAPGEDDDEDVSRLLMEQSAAQPRAFRKRWRDIGGFDERFPYKSVAKRFPVTKRSLKSTSEPKNRPQSHANNAGTTDPEVAQELDNIFSASGEANSKKNMDESHDDHHSVNTTDNSKPETKKKSLELYPEKKEKSNQKDDKEEKNKHSVHRRDKEVAGQKEVTNAAVDDETKPVDVKKKSIDWSEYFGIDRRRKKSASDSFDDEWLLNQYLQAYSHPKQLKAEALREAELESKNQIPDTDDIDGKLRAMEDLIVEEALKYTGANQGLDGANQAHKVKQRVMSQLAAAYSLEKMRRALGEFKSSITGNAESDGDDSLRHHSTPSPTPDAPKKESSKRVAVKKEKAEQGSKDKKFEKVFQEDIDKNYLPVEKPLHSVPVSRYYSQKVESCPILDDIIGQCRQISIMAGDTNELLLPLCTLHQTCSICGGHGTRAGAGASTPDDCDMAFLSQMTLCGHSTSCRLSARRMLAAMISRRARSFPAPDACDVNANPCLAPFLRIRR